MNAARKNYRLKKILKEIKLFEEKVKYFKRKYNSLLIKMLTDKYFIDNEVLN